MQRPRGDDLHQPRRKPALREPIRQPRPVEVIQRLLREPIVARREHRDLRRDHRVARILHLLVIGTVLKRLVGTQPHRAQRRPPNFLQARVRARKLRRHLIRIRREPIPQPTNRERLVTRRNRNPDIPKRPPMQRLEHLARCPFAHHAHPVRLIPRRFPAVAPTGNFPAPVKRPARALVRKMRGQIRQRLLPPQQFRPRRAPGQPERLRIREEHRTPAPTRRLDLRKPRRQLTHIDDHLHRRARRHRHALPLRNPIPPRHRRLAATRQKHVFKRRAHRTLLQRRNHARHQPIRARRIAPIHQQLRPIEHRRRRPPGVVELRGRPPLRNQFRHTVLKIPLIPLEGRALILKPMRGVHRDVPFRVRRHVIAYHGCAAFAATRRPVAPQYPIQHKPARRRHHRTRRAEVRRPMRHPRHIEHERRKDVAPLPQPRRQFEGLVELVIHVPLRRTASDQFPVTEKQIPAVPRHMHLQPRRLRVHDCKRPSKHPHLVVRGRGRIRSRRGMGRLRGPNPRGSLGEGGVRHTQGAPHRQHCRTTRARE